MLILEVIFWLSVAACVYVYFGYPLLLLAAGALRPRPVRKAAYEPSVSVVIAAHNEERQIAAKLENTLALDYPRELLEVIVASDGSTDSTEEIVARYEGGGVKLLPLARCGKMRALNQAVARAAGGVVVLTDANAELEPGALKELLSPFADASVGGVCGNQKYRRAGAGDSAGEGENLYWTYDKWVKQLETRVGSTVAADGSIYALRRELYVPIEDGAQADDFAVSARVVTVGRARLVYEPAAVSYEPTPAKSDTEFRRKVRVANHCMRAILNLEGGLNPFRTGLYAVEMWSHKVMRYGVPLFAAAALAADSALAAGSWFYMVLLAGQILFYALALAGYALRRTRLGRLKPLYAPFYFCLANAAALFAVLSLMRGERITVWQPQREITQVGGGDK
ncbi:MAG TPA: glycosyltransferase family 2 protein [Pyrinomonadaceae bacterium]|nr:glycosyltransferase family 2 protein [Pyrinomonadaceae bacterium]